MSYSTMAAELTGIVSKLPPDYALTLVQRARQDLYRKSLWSFLMFEGNWTSPGLITGGTASVTQGTNTVVFNATASAALTAQVLGPPSALIQRQFRVGVGTIYNIWGYAASNTGIVTLTLDRNYQEPTNAATAYTVFQCYYASPVIDWWKWLGVRDMINYNDLIYTKPRSYFDEQDPQRILYYIPTHVAPYQLDMNPISPTYGFMLFELWGSPQYAITYQLAGIRKGAPFVNQSDTLPNAIGEDVVIALATGYAYKWAEANWQRSWGEKPNFMPLLADCRQDYNRLFREYRLQDRGLVDNFKVKLRRAWAWPNLDGWYSSIGGSASPGAPW